VAATIRYPDAAARRGQRPLVALVGIILVALAAAGCVGVTSPQGWAGPVAFGDTVFVAIERERMAALKADDLSVQWLFPPDTEQGKAIKLEAIYGAPVVTKDTVYFGAYDGNVYALNTADGAVRWPFETGGPVIGGVALYEPDPKQRPEASALFVGSDDGVLYALDPATGSEKRRFDAGDSIWAAPLIVDSTLYLASVNGKLFALNADTLEPVWDEPFEADGGLVTDPVLADENTLLVGGIDRRLYALDKATGKEKWSLAGDNWFWGRPLVSGTTIFVPNMDHHVYAIELGTGQPVWQTPFETKAPVRASPLLVDDVLIVADRAGNVYGLDPADGSQKWAQEILNKTLLADPVLLKDEVLLVAQGGDLYRLDPAAGTSSLVEVR